jgi:TetR/AcrR family tetracycline transcriptional repressor
MPVTPEQIVATAMRLLDRDGIEGVSFRKIGAELGVSAPTLYWHVDSKRRLLDLMADALMTETNRRESLEPLPGEPWWEWLERRTSAVYDTLVRHRDAPRVVAGNRPTVASLPYIESLLGHLVDAGFEPVEALEAVLMLGAYATGCALESQAEAERGVEGQTGELGAAVREGGYPRILSAFRALHDRHLAVGSPQPHNPHDHMFRHGLRMIVTGLRASHEGADPGGAQVSAVLAAALDVRASDFANEAEKAPASSAADR